MNPVVGTRRDAFGRITSVSEPTGESTTYGYDVNGKVVSVTQGVQTRTFELDTTGLLRSETTPEEGQVQYGSVGSLGNVRQETRPGGVVLTRTFDFAGRLAEEDAGGLKYLVNCYDGKATCVDGSAGFGGGSYPAGKLTRRYGHNRIPTVGPVVDEQFEYTDGGGRLSQARHERGKRRPGAFGQPDVQLRKSRRRHHARASALDGRVSGRQHLYQRPSDGAERQRRECRHRRDLQPGGGPGVVDGRQLRRGDRDDHRPGRDHAPAPREHRELFLVDGNVHVRRRRRTSSRWAPATRSPTTRAHAWSRRSTDRTCALSATTATATSPRTARRSRSTRSTTG